MMRFSPVLRFWVCFVLGCLLSLSLPTFGSQVGVASPPFNSPTLAQSQEPGVLLRQGRADYEAGEMTEAVRQLQAAARAYGERGERLNQAIALNYLSLSQQQQGEWQAARAAIEDSLGLVGVPDARAQNDRQRVFAAALTTRGQLQLSLAEAEAAFESWQEAERVYQRLGDTEGTVGSQLNQALALEALGFYRRACDQLLGGLTGDRLTCDGLAADDPQLREGQQRQLLAAINRQADSPLKAMALRSLGNQLRVLGQLEISERILQASLNTSELERDRSLAYLSLGNTLKAKVNRAFNLRQFDLGDDDNLIQASSLDSYAMTALGYYQRAIDLSSSPSLRLQGQLNRLDILSDLIRIIPQKAEYLQTQLDFELIVISRLNPLANNYRQQIAISSRQVEQFTQEAEQLIDQIYPQLSLLPLSNIKVESQLKLACHTIDCNQINLQKPTNNLGLNQESVLNLIQESITEAEQLGSLELQSYGYGVLGKFQEKSQNWDEAITATRNALALSKQGVRRDLSYQWQWQMGRILQTRHEENLGVADVSIEAIHSYRQASQTLKQLRQDLATLDSRIQYDFRDNVEPVYKQFVELLLRGDNVNTESLEEARNAIEDLRIAELNNFFQDACIREEEFDVDDIIDQQDPTAALIYTIILDDRLEVIAKLPGQDLSHHSVTKDEQGDFQAVLWNLYSGLIDVAKNQTDVQPNAQKLYEWLIAPLSSQLEESHVKTLVFFLDTILQRIPMSVLYNQDTDKFLIQDYAIAITPGIKIIQPQSFDTVGVSVLAGGLSESRENLPELLGVKREIEDISQLLPTQVLLNQTFTRSAVENLVGSGLFSVIHLATHGNFSSDPEKTYLVLSDELLKVRSMDAVFGLNPLARANVIELLVMSACKTAKGDERAALGLSGMAVRSGARSTVATLWSADDESTADVMSNFYQQLKAGKNKAEALRAAQLNFLNQLTDQGVENSEMEFRKWAPYILVGNWL